MLMMHLNRITSATTQATTGSDCWGQSFTYADRYGNLSQITGTQTGCSVPGLSVSINSAKNQINTGGYQYDSAGNLTNDPTPLTYAWDAEERLTSVAGVTYTYDGRGRRVQKSSGTMEWYGVDGKLLAETDSSGNLVSEFVYFGGRPVARRDASGAVYYYSGDALGSVRAVTDSTGNVQLMSEYYPYGGERIVTSSMDDRHKFTGKMRDTETGLDHYDYRMLSSTMGRWMSVDKGRPLMGNPQSLNRYAYVLGNPTKFTDSDGRRAGSSNSRGIIDNYVLAEISGAGGGGNLCGPDSFDSLVTFEPVPSSSSSDGSSNADGNNTDSSLPDAPTPQNNVPPATVNVNAAYPPGADEISQEISNLSLSDLAPSTQQAIAAISSTLGLITPPEPDYINVSFSLGLWSPSFTLTNDNAFATPAAVGTPGGSPAYVTMGYVNGALSNADVDNFVQGGGSSVCGFMIVGGCTTFSPGFAGATEYGVGLPGFGGTVGYTNQMGPGPNSSNPDPSAQVPLGGGLYYTPDTP